MAFFKPSNPIATIENDLQRLSARRVALQDKHAAARNAHAAAASARADLLGGEFSDQQLEQADEACAEKQRALTGAADAVAAIDTLIVDGERRLGEARDQAQRQQTAKMMADVHARIQTAFDAHRKTTNELTTALRMVSSGADLAMQFGGMLEMFSGEVATLLRVLEGRRAEVLAGGAMPAIREETTAEPPATPVERVNVYLFESAKWIDPERGRLSSWKYSVVSLPVAIAERAIKLGVAVPELDQRASHMAAVYGRVHGPSVQFMPDAKHDLDAAEPLAIEAAGAGTALAEAAA